MLKVRLLVAEVAVMLVVHVIKVRLMRISSRGKTNWLMGQPSLDVMWLLNSVASLFSTVSAVIRLRLDDLTAIAKRRSYWPKIGLADDVCARSSLRIYEAGSLRHSFWLGNFESRSKISRQALTTKQRNLATTNPINHWVAWSSFPSWCLCWVNPNIKSQAPRFFPSFFCLFGGWSLAVFDIACI